MKLNYTRVVDWAMHRRILDESTAQYQMLKGTEEHGEKATAILNDDRAEIIDAVVVQLVVAIVQCAQLGYMEELDDWCQYENTVMTRSGFKCRENLLHVLTVTSAQGEVAGDLARSRCARESFRKLFDSLYGLCFRYDINPCYALDSVYDIISKRDGVMRNGVWVKVGDL